VKAILAASGGIGAIQLLDGIDYELFRRFPKILCGYSDTLYAANAVYARAGVITYHGPNFSSFMMKRGAEETLRSFQECLMGERPMNLRPASEWSDDNWAADQENRTFSANEGFWTLHEGETEGIIACPVPANFTRNFSLNITGNFAGIGLFSGSQS